MDNKPALALIQTARERAGSLAQVSDTLGLSKSGLHTMETEGRGLAAARRWYALLLHLGLKPGDFLGPSLNEDTGPPP